MSGGERGDEMATAAEAIAEALKFHRAGDLGRAEQIYRDVLRAEPNNVDALHLLGLIAHQAGHLDAALQLIRQALLLRPNFPEAHSNLGNALSDRGELDEAVFHYREAVRLRPTFADAHNNLGNALRRLGRPDPAACYREALRLRPDYPEAHNNLGDLLLAARRLDESEVHLRQALRLNPRYAAAHNNLGALLRHQNRLAEAEASLHEALRLAPNYVEAHNNLGNVLKDRGRPADAEACYRHALQLRPDSVLAHNNLGALLTETGRAGEAVATLGEALRLNPKYPEAHNNLGNALREQGDVDGALASYRRALGLRPDYPEAHNNLGATLAQHEQFDEALACYGRALEPRPDYAQAHLNRALAWLLLGDYERGWPEYEWRLKARDAVPLARPRWDGAPLQGKTILLHAEQGLGDTIQFARFAALVEQKGGTVVLACQKPLSRLLAGCAGYRLVALDEALPPFDVHAPLLSLPAILGTTLATVPADVPYLRADPALTEHWRAELAALPGFKVGIAWQGNPGYPWDRARSIPLKEFAALAAVDSVRLVSLQKGPGTEQLGQIDFPVLDLGKRLDEANGPFVDTAALIAALDLVVTSDSAVAHLAGALGARAWVVLPKVPDYRWLLGRGDCPWYPTVRLFRQERPGDWASVFRRVADELPSLRPGSGLPPTPVSRTPALRPLMVRAAPGDVLDRITILRIKAERLTDPRKLDNVRREREALEAAWKRQVPASEELLRLEAELGEVNAALWDVEDALREHERRQDFGPAFVALARSVYRHNDCRTALKREANELLGSAIVEEKSYAAKAAPPPPGSR